MTTTLKCSDTLLTAYINGGLPLDALLEDVEAAELAAETRGAVDVGHSFSAMALDTLHHHWAGRHFEAQSLLAREEARRQMHYWRDASRARTVSGLPVGEKPGGFSATFGGITAHNPSADEWGESAATPCGCGCGCTADNFDPIGSYCKRCKVGDCPSPDEDVPQVCHCGRKSDLATMGEFGYCLRGDCEPQY